jgi:predicted O-methyltransferase YrrM
MNQPQQEDKYIVNPEIEEYILALTPAGDEILEEMEEHARRNEFPIVGPLVGRFLYETALISNANKVLELGSGFGYSAYWFAKAIGESGSLTFTDMSHDNARIAGDFFNRAGLRDRIDIRIGNAVKILEESAGGFDIIFNDIDKEYYPRIVDKAYDKLKKGGLFIADNVLWRGRVLTGDGSPSTEGVREFTRLLISHKGFFTTIIPLRDGVSLSVKL